MTPRRRISFLAFFLLWATVQRWEVPALHVRMCQWLERFYYSGRVGVLEVFRGAAKSTIVAVFQAWILYEDRAHRILDQAADNPTARKLSRDTRGVLRRHPLCAGMLPRDDMAVESIRIEGHDDERNPNVSAHGVLSNVTSSRADTVVFDDVEVPKNVRSDEARELLRDRLGEATHILVPGGRKLYIGTPHTHNSIYDEQAAAGADVLKIPLFAHHVRYEDTTAQRRFSFNFEATAAELYVFIGSGRSGRLLVGGTDYRVDRRAVVFESPPGALVDIYAGCAWSERFTRDDIAFRRAESRTLNAWDSQYHLHAKPLHEIRLDPARIIPYDVEPVVTVANGEVRMMLGGTRIVGASVYWDCALGKVRGDDSALALVFTNDAGALFWHRAQALSGDVFQQCDRIRDLVARYQLSGVTVETNGPGGFVPPILRKALAGIECGVREEFQTTAKDGRILDALEPPLSGRFLWAHTTALDVIEQQLQNWVPGVAGQRDDFIDAGAGAIRQTPIRIGKVVTPGERQASGEWRPNAGDFEIRMGD